ncbi:MAG TPA: hypothetical protein VEA40_00515 [Ramlibacter sp.]|nr:hypothetical protein [Ramlibacter sp.]
MSGAAATEKEIVLPSGRFAGFRPLTFRDFREAAKAPSEDFVPTLATRSVTIDGKTPSIEELLDMDLGDWMAVSHVLNQAFERAMKTQGGVA